MLNVMLLGMRDEPIEDLLPPDDVERVNSLIERQGRREMSNKLIAELRRNAASRSGRLGFGIMLDQRYMGWGLYTPIEPRLHQFEYELMPDTPNPAEVGEITLGLAMGQLSYLGLRGDALLRTISPDQVEAAERSKFTASPEDGEGAYRRRIT